MTFKRIASISKVRRGASPRPIDDPKYFGGNVGWVRIADVSASKKYLRQTTQYVSALGEQNSVRVDKGDLILSICGTIGKPVIIDIPACIHDGFVLLYDIKESDNEYLYYCLQFSEERLKGQGQSGTQANLNTSLVGDLEIFHPLLEEQTQIAAVLSCIDRAIEHTEALIAKQQRIKTGLMQDLLTKGIDEHGNIRSEATHEFKDSPLGRIPKEWEVFAIEKKLERLIDYRGKTPLKSVSGVPLLTAKIIKLGYMLEPDEFIPEDVYEQWMTRGFPKVGDVLFTSEAPLGNVAQIKDERVALGQRVLTLQTTTDLNSDFLFYLLLHLPIRLQFEILSTGSTVTGIKQSQFRQIKILLPKIEEQVKIVAILKAIAKTIRQEEIKLSKLKPLKTGLMQDLLTGQVSVSGLLAESSAGIAS